MKPSGNYKPIKTFPFGSKEREYARSIELFEQIFKEQGTYFALAFLYDSGYTDKDLLGMMKIIFDSVKEK